MLQEAELLFRAAARRRSTIVPEYSRCIRKLDRNQDFLHFLMNLNFLNHTCFFSVLLLLAKCCIRAGKILHDTAALEEALKCAEEVIQIGSDAEHGKLLQIQALVMLER